MFKLKIYDRKGIELKEGDIVKISDGRRFTFYCEVKYLEKEMIITPFHTFSFHSVEKVNEVPVHAIKSTEERYSIWYVDHDVAEADNNRESFEKYLSDWRCCEYTLKERMYRIERIKS